jgi:hypothetical protein
VRRPLELREMYLEHDKVIAATEPTLARHDQLIEQMYPGWKVQGLELNERVRESMASALADAQADSQDELDAQAVSDILLEHWKRLGGIAPDPL